MTMAVNTKAMAHSDRISAFWETEKHSPCIIPRILHIQISKLCINIGNGESGDTAVYLALKMHGSARRTLRSQQITLPERGVVVEHPITVEITYPHAIKRGNPILVLLQRRKKYRNLGFKTLGVREIDLSDILQRRLINCNVELYPHLKPEPGTQPVGFLHVSRFETLPPREVNAPGAGGYRQEDEYFSDEEETDPAEDEMPMTKPKEWKQKLKLFMDENFATILKSKKLKVPEILNNESLWNELQRLEPDSSSSLDGDEISVHSTPKPSLRRYFGSQTSADQFFPSRYNASSPRRRSHLEQGALADEEDEPKPLEKSRDLKLAQSFEREPALGHLTTVESEPPKPLISLEPRRECIEAVSRLLEGALPDKLVVVNTLEMGGKFLLDTLSLDSVKCVPMSSVADARHLLSHLLSAMGKTGSSRSGPESSGPLKICLAGSDAHVNSALRAFVEQLGTRPADWQSRLRFFCVPLTQLGAIHKFLCSVDASYAGLFDDWRELCVPETARGPELVKRLHQYLNGAKQVVQLPIGEVMLAATSGEAAPSPQSFIPFVVDVRIGLPENPDSDSEPGGTPPLSPNLGADQGEFVDLQLDFWTAGSERKNALKPAFRALHISRLGENTSRSLCMTVVNKEKKQKIMRIGKKAKELERQREVMESVSRVICTGKNQQHQMKVVIDGVHWPSVKFFQLSHQWQTNVKHFPVAIFSSPPVF